MQELEVSGQTSDILIPAEGFQAVGRGLFSLFAAWFPDGATIFRPYPVVPPPLSEPCLRYLRTRLLTVQGKPVFGVPRRMPSLALLDILENHTGTASTRHLKIRSKTSAVMAVQ